MRELTQTVYLHPQDFIQPLFVSETTTAPVAIPGMPDVYRDSTQSLPHQIEADLKSGTTKFLLFGMPKDKHHNTFNTDFLLGQIESLKTQFGQDIWLATDVCLCAYTTHGHCGILNSAQTDLHNAQTTQALAEVALQYAQAGADAVAPSDMMDSRVAAIRACLNAHDHDATPIMSYSAKFASSYYGPFRMMCDSNPQQDIPLKDRATYQLDYKRHEDAYLCSVRDWEEGADILMVKPALMYLDILKTLTAEIPLPFAAYQVGGEYASIMAAAKDNLLDAPSAMREAWYAMKRAGCAMIISYAARHATAWLAE